MKRKYIPSPDQIRENTYVTYRRLWLDACLRAFTSDIYGIVLDLGGKRENKRGSFQPPEHEAQAWWYLNLDWITKPNVFADVTETPLKTASVDCILCTEVLEHLKDPQACVDEIYRLLRNDGLVLASTPFFYPVHADPYDFQRFTEDGLRHLFREFRSVDVYRMGGYYGVLGLLCELGIPGEDGKTFRSKVIRWLLKWFSRALCSLDIAIYSSENSNRQKFTTGYFIRAIR